MSTEMPKDLKKWATTRQQGKAKFILVQGVLAWGLPMFAVMTFVVNRRKGEAVTNGMIAISAVIWAIGGALFGWSIWSMSEKKYQKYLSTQTPPPLPPPPPA